MLGSTCDVDGHARGAEPATGRNVGAWLEHLFAAGHGAWWGRWEAWQLAAIATGALVLLRTSGRHTLRPFVAALPFGIAGALVLGSGGAWASWLVTRHGAPPDVELAGMGALVGLAAGYALVSGGRGVSPARALDELARALGPMWALARVGCFFAGCDFGAPMRAPLPWAMRYPQGTAAFATQQAAGLVTPADALTGLVHPVQLYECLAGVALAIVAAAPGGRTPGSRFFRTIVAFAALRACTDLARGDLPRDAWGFTATQWVALAITGVAVTWRASRTSAREPEG